MGSGWKDEFEGEDPAVNDEDGMDETDENEDAGLLEIAEELGWYMNPALLLVGMLLIGLGLGLLMSSGLDDASSLTEEWSAKQLVLFGFFESWKKKELGKYI